MAVLHNPRHEQFAQLVASGKTPAEAYVAAGYAAKTAYTCGPRLLKTASVRARVAELQRTVAQAATTAVALDCAFVLRELMDNALTAKQNQQWSASNRALELLGKQLGMFVERAEHTEYIAVAQLLVSGDLSALTDEQLAQLHRLISQLGGAKREPRALGAAEAGADAVVVDVEPEPAGESDKSEWL